MKTYVPLHNAFIAACLHRSRHISRRSLITIVGASVCCAMLFSAGGCSRSASESDSATAPEAPGKPKVALIMKSLANEFFSTMADGAVKHQADNAEQYTLLVNGIKDERDITRQVALV